MRKKTKSISTLIVAKPEIFVNFDNLKNIKLNTEQSEARKLILRNPVTILTGKAGSGKTLCSTYIGIEQLYKGNVEKIVITRPTVGTEDIGYLKGGLEDKMQPWMVPIYDSIRQIVGNDEYNLIIKHNKIEIVPLQFFRGRTFLNSFVIVDETQNLNREQTKMVLSRLGQNSKMVLCGDLEQTDLKKKTQSGLNDLINMSSVIEEIGFLELKHNHRHPIVDKILEYFTNSL